MGLFDWLKRWTSDNRERRDEQETRKISPAMPMAGASAQLAAEPEQSESEQALRRAATSDKQNNR